MARLNRNTFGRKTHFTTLVIRNALIMIDKPSDRETSLLGGVFCSLTFRKLSKLNH